MREHVEVRTLAERLDVPPSVVEAKAAELELTIVKTGGGRYLTLRAAGRIVEALSKPRGSGRWTGSSHAVR